MELFKVYNQSLSRMPSQSAALEAAFPNQGKAYARSHYSEEESLYCQKHFLRFLRCEAALKIEEFQVAIFEQSVIFLMLTLDYLSLFFSQRKYFTS